MSEAKVPRAKDIMTRRLQVLGPHTEVVDAAKALLRRHHSGVPVVDEGGRLLGVFTEYDCVRAMAAVLFGEEPAGTVQTYMTEAVERVDAELPLDELSRRFVEARVRRLLVVEDGVLVGLVARRDLLDGLQSMFEKRRIVTTYEAIAATR